MHRENTHTEKKGRPLCIYKSIYNKKEENKREQKRREDIYILYDSVYDTDHNTTLFEINFFLILDSPHFTSREEDDWFFYQFKFNLYSNSYE